MPSFRHPPPFPYFCLLAASTFLFVHSHEVHQETSALKLLRSRLHPPLSFSAARIKPGGESDQPGRCQISPPLLQSVEVVIALCLILYSTATPSGPKLSVRQTVKAQKAQGKEDGRRARLGHVHRSLRSVHRWRFDVAFRACEANHNQRMRGNSGGSSRTERGERDRRQLAEVNRQTEHLGAKMQQGVEQYRVSP